MRPTSWGHRGPSGGARHSRRARLRTAAGRPPGVSGVARALRESGLCFPPRVPPAPKRCSRALGSGEMRDVLASSGPRVWCALGLGLGDGGRSGGGPPDACHAGGARPGSSGSAPRGAHPASAGAPSALEWSRLWVGGPGWWLLAEVGTPRASLTEAANAGAPSSGGQAWEQRLLPAGLPFRPPIPCPPRVGGRAAVGHVHWSASLAAGPGAGPRGLARPRPDLCTAAPLWPGHRSG